MFKIGEFSRLTQISIRMLRYYDQMQLLKPAIIDPRTGYRLYSAEQIPVLNKIIYLRDSGFSVGEISRILQNNSSDHLLRALRKKEQEVSEAIQSEKEKLEKISRIRHELQSNRNNELHYNITIKAVPSQLVLSLRRIIPTYYAEEQLWRELSAFAQQKNITLNSNCFSIYHDMEYKEHNVDVELCAPLQKQPAINGKLKVYETPAIPFMAYTLAYGDFSNIAPTYCKFAYWLKNNRYQLAGPDRQLIHRGPWNENTPDNYLTEIQIPVAKIPEEK